MCLCSVRIDTCQWWRWWRQCWCEAVMWRVVWPAACPVLLRVERLVADAECRQLTVRRCRRRTCPRRSAAPLSHHVRATRSMSVIVLDRRPVVVRRETAHRHRHTTKHHVTSRNDLCLLHRVSWAASSVTSVRRRPKHKDNTANLQSVCLRRKTFQWPYLCTCDLENLISSRPEYVQYLCKFWFKAFSASGALSRSRDFHDRRCLSKTCDSTNGL